MLPRMMQDPLASTLFALACAAAGAAVGAAGLVRFAGWRRAICAALFGVVVAMTSWFVWTL